MRYIGVDWADQKHDAVAIDEGGHKLDSIRVAHTPEGLTRLDTWLSSLLGEQSKEQTACIIETTHGLLIAFLLERGWPVYPVNPRTVDRSRGTSGAKTDLIDAHLLAKTGRANFPELHRLTPDSEIIAEIKGLTRDQDGLIRMQTRLVNQLTACLKEYYPAARSLFTKLQQRSTLLFLQTYPTPEAARAASVEQIAQVLKSAGHTTAKKVAPEVFAQLHQPALQASAVTTRIKSRLALALIAQLLPVLEQIAFYDKEIQRLFLSHPDHEIIQSLPGAGKHLAPRLLAEVGDDASRYQSAASLQALGGTSPVLFQSGHYAKPHRRLGCIKPLRNALQQFAWHSTHQAAWAEIYYKRKRTEGKSHSVAVRALSNIWARIMYALLKSHQPYDPRAFEAAQRAHQRHVA